MIKRLIIMAIFLMGSLTMVSCGYTTRSSLATNLRTIHIRDFKNKISYVSGSSSRNLYIPLVEVDIQKGIADRFLFDGNLKIDDEDEADLVLKGELVNYDRRVLRFTDDDDAQEYRIYLYVNLQLIDPQSGETLWSESNFVGESTYFISGPLAKSEDLAIEEAISDLARRVVERTVEDW